MLGSGWANDGDHDGDVLICSLVVGRAAGPGAQVTLDFSLLWKHRKEQGMSKNAAHAAAVSSLEEENNQQLDVLLEQVNRIKRVSMNIYEDLEADGEVRGQVNARIDKSQTNMMSTLENLSVSFASSKRTSALKIAGLIVVAMIMLYLVLSVRM